MTAKFDQIPLPTLHGHDTLGAIVSFWRMFAVKKLATGILIALTALSLTACNTIRGMGQDVERAGEAVQDATD